MTLQLGRHPVSGENESGQRVGVAVEHAVPCAGDDMSPCPRQQSNERRNNCLRSRGTGTAVCCEYRIIKTGELVDSQSLGECGADIATIPNGSSDNEVSRRGVQSRKTAGAKPVVDHLGNCSGLAPLYAVGISAEETNGWLKCLLLASQIQCAKEYRFK